MTTIFVDMDDVVANFSKEALRIAGYLMPDTVTEKYPLDEWNKFLENPRLYLNLEKCSNADLIVQTCLEIASIKGWDVKFLTAVPRDNDFPWAFTDKIFWANKYFPGIPVWFGPYSRDKHRHCQKNDILIDDRAKNIKEWIDAGGIGIHHGEAHNTIQQLKALL